MAKYELTNARTIRANGNKRMVEGMGNLMQVATKAGYKNIRSETGSAGKTIWVGDVNEYITGGMFAIER